MTTAKQEVPSPRARKRKVSVSLDADLAEEFERDGSLSAQVNQALRAELSRRRHQAALADLITELTGDYGPLDTPEDEAAIARYVDLLS